MFPILISWCREGLQPCNQYPKVFLTDASEKERTKDLRDNLYSILAHISDVRQALRVSWELYGCCKNVGCVFCNLVYKINALVGKWV